MFKNIFYASHQQQIPFLSFYLFQLSPLFLYKDRKKKKKKKEEKYAIEYAYVCV